MSPTTSVIPTRLVNLCIGSFFIFTAGCADDGNKDIPSDNEGPSASETGDGLDEPGIDLGEALDNAGLRWRTGSLDAAQPEARWVGAEGVGIGAPGGDDDAARSDGTTSGWVETTVSGPAKINFWWKNEYGLGASDQIEFLVDGVLAARRGRFSDTGPLNDRNWHQNEYKLGEREDQQLRWVYSIEAPSPGLEAGTVWLDGVTVTELPRYGDALDAPELQWSSGGSPGWVIAEGAGEDGGDAIQVSYKEYNQAKSSWIETVVTGPGELKFWWLVREVNNGRYMKLYIDSGDGSIDRDDWVTRRDSTALMFDEPAVWEELTFTVPEGEARIRWSYDFDCCGATGTAMLDRVTFTPGS